MKRFFRAKLDDGSWQDLELDYFVTGLSFGNGDRRNINLDQTGPGKWRLSFNTDWIPTFQNVAKIRFYRNEAQIIGLDGTVLHSLHLPIAKAVKSDNSFIYLDQLKDQDRWKLLYSENLFPPRTRLVELEIIREA